MKVLAATLTPTNKEHTNTNNKQACASRLGANAYNLTPQEQNYDCNKQANEQVSGIARCHAETHGMKLRS